jgi:hypothetical protein
MMNINLFRLLYGFMLMTRVFHNLRRGNIATLDNAHIMLRRDFNAILHTAVQTPIYSLSNNTLCPEKSGPPKLIAIKAANLYRFNLNFTHMKTFQFQTKDSVFLRSTIQYCEI